MAADGDEPGSAAGVTAGAGDSRGEGRLSAGLTDAPLAARPAGAPHPLDEAGREVLEILRAEVTLLGEELHQAWGRHDAGDARFPIDKAPGEAADFHPFVEQ